MVQSGQRLRLFCQSVEDVLVTCSRTRVVSDSSSCRDVTVFSSIWLPSLMALKISSGSSLGSPSLPGERERTLAEVQLMTEGSGFKRVTLARGLCVSCTGSDSVPSDTAWPRLHRRRPLIDNSRLLPVGSSVTSLCGETAIVSRTQKQDMTSSRLNALLVLLTAQSTLHHLTGGDVLPPKSGMEPTTLHSRFTTYHSIDVQWGGSTLKVLCNKTV